MKKMFFVITLIFALTVFVTPAMAADIKIVIDGKPVSSDVAPVVANNRTLVPIRVISENLGAKVDYHNGMIDIKSPYLYHYDFSLWMNSVGVYSYRDIPNEYYFYETHYENGVYYGTPVEYYLDIPPYVKNGRALVPLRFVAEMLKCDVDYRNNTVTVTSMPKGKVSRDNALSLAAEQCKKDLPVTQKELNEWYYYFGHENEPDLYDAWLEDINKNAYLVAVSRFNAFNLYRVDKFTGEAALMVEGVQDYWPGMIDFETTELN